MKVWLATMIVAPVICILLMCMIAPAMIGDYPVASLTTFVIILGFIFSMPTLLFLSVFALI